MAKVALEMIYYKLNEIDQKVSALLMKEEKSSKEELRAIQAGKAEFAQKKFHSWEQVKVRTE